MKSIDIRDVVDSLSPISANFPGGIFYGWTKKDHKSGTFVVLNKVTDNVDGIERIVRVECRICSKDDSEPITTLDACEKALEDTLAFVWKRSYGPVTAFKCVRAGNAATGEDEKGRKVRVVDFIFHCVA